MSVTFVFIAQESDTDCQHDLPDGLVIAQSSICNAGQGVFTAVDFTLRKDMIFGPYAGVMVFNEVKAHESGYSWQV